MYLVTSYTDPSIMSQQSFSEACSATCCGVYVLVVDDCFVLVDVEIVEFEEELSLDVFISRNRPLPKPRITIRVIIIFFIPI